MAEPFLPPPTPHHLTALIDRIEENADGFAEYFATQLLLANGGNRGAITRIESFFEPIEEELSIFGVHESQWNSMKKCTDSGRLALVTLKKIAPQAFENAG